MVIESGYIDIDFLAQEAAISELIAVQLFGREARVGVESCEIRRTVGRVANIAQEVKILLGIGRRAYGVRESGPDGLVFAGCPEQAYAGLEVYVAGEIGLQHFRSQNQRQSLFHQLDLVLDERGSQIIGSLVRNELQTRDQHRIVHRIHASAQAPGNLLPRRQAQPLQEIDIEGVAYLHVIGRLPIGAIVIYLQLEIVPVAENSFPAAQDIFTGKVRVGIYDLRVGRRIAGGLHALSGDFIVGVPLQRESVLACCPVHAKAQLTLAPVIEISPVGVVLRTARETHAINAITEAVAIAAPIAEIEKALLFVSAAGRRQESPGVFGVLGDDIDYTVHRVRTPNGAARSADHLNAVDIVHVGVLNVPVGAGEKWRVNRAAVNQDQNGTRQIGPEAANADRPIVAVDARYLHARRQPQRFRNAGCARTPDVFTCDDVDGGRGLRNLGRFLGRRRHFNLGELFQGQLL